MMYRIYGFLAAIVLIGGRNLLHRVLSLVRQSLPAYTAMCEGLLVLSRL